MTNRVMVDLFAGSGGMGLGMELAGFQPVFVSELHPHALETYLMNRAGPVRDPENQARDILEYTQDSKKLGELAKRLNREYGSVDLIVGGPPCQGYSGIGHRRTFTDLSKFDIPSNHLYREMAHFISAVSPKAFVFENVRGLLSSRWTPTGKRGGVWDSVLSEFEGIQTLVEGATVGYTVRHAVVKAGDYGVPQNRPRVLVVGVRRDLNFEPAKAQLADGLIPAGARVAPDLVDVLGDLIDPDWAPNTRSTPMYPRASSPGLINWFRTYPERGVARKGMSLTEHEYSRHSSRVTERFVTMQLNQGRVPPEMRTKKFAQRLLRPTWDGGKANITVASLPDDYVHWEQPRTLTVREWARLQTFPDWYQFVGKRTTGGRRRAGDPDLADWARELPKYTQIGNAVPVFLARSLGIHLARLLDALEAGRVPEMTEPEPDLWMTNPGEVKSANSGKGDPARADAS